eukprot:4320971-Alexandrium_andersonii.AAC.1
MDVRRRDAQESILRARGQGRTRGPLGPFGFVCGADACIGAAAHSRVFICHSSAERGRAPLCGHGWSWQQE